MSKDANKGELNIVLCDDNVNIIQEVKQLLSQISSKSNFDFWINAYTSSTELIKDLKTGRMDFHMIFLDIDMPENSGFDIAKIIASLDYDNYFLIFLTAYSNYVYEAIKLSPFRYIRKSHMDTELPEAIESALKIIERENEDEFIMLLTQNYIKKIAQKDIVYFELVDRKLIIHMKNTGTFIIRKTMKELYASCNPDNFAWINSGCIVNLRYVNKLENNTVLLDNGTQLYISRTRKVEFKKKFLSYWSDCV
ncbi:DNA-binding response regulator, LytR/AlgR family [Acetitomaculum ruminis DSM 5522]|uniref:Stage 0 sporulation protein A homolog n=1 Tax=Acetitomaculum ruminis DSM 5522 TaxID=1120918 RepID=A0A1I0UZ92_9FIRM|nr:LytTR family DNA-binding domain-containing protein [Acetitomaculum ruminis]SFA69414.1 DNA-binding response regulator, LytR/AlgR family [Acetitomaculum ruminis DSM 5522]